MKIWKKNIVKIDFEHLTLKNNEDKQFLEE